MKRCPQCNRVETDHALTYCRNDGAPLVNDSSSIESEAGTVQLGSGKVASEPSSDLSPTATDTNFSRVTAPTTVLPRLKSSSDTHSLNNPKRRWVVIAGSIVVLVGIAAGLYFYSGKRTRVIDSVAVLPFQNASGDKETEFLSDGISETLINNFTRIPSLRVTARSTAFRYKGKDIDPQQIAQELSVGAILTGKVLQRGDSLSIQVDLINATDGSQIWGDSYNGKVSEILDLQQRIARDVSDNLKWKLSGEQRQQIAKTYTANPEAYQLYLQGRFYWNKRTAENIKKAIEQFRAATDKDPNYALAYAGLADCYLLLEEYAGTPVSESLPQAKAFAARALQIDDALAEAHVSLGLIHDHSWQWADAETEFKRAIELNPNYPTAHHWYSVYLRDVGRYDDALTEIQRAKELDPLSLIINFNEALAYYIKGDNARALAQLNKTMELDPNYPGARVFLGRMYLRQGRFQEALEEMQNAASVKQTLNLRFQGYALALAGKRNEALAIAEQLEARYAARQAIGQDIALVYVGLGDMDKAFSWLEKDFQARSGIVQFVRSFPEFESLRSDKRYADLMRRIGLST